MIVELLLQKDEASTGCKYDHYTFGNRRSPINGGIYVEKGQEMPEKIILVQRRSEESDERA